MNDSINLVVLRGQIKILAWAIKIDTLRNNQNKSNNNSLAHIILLYLKSLFYRKKHQQNVLANRNKKMLIYHSFVIDSSPRSIMILPTFFYDNINL